MTNKQKTIISIIGIVVFWPLMMFSSSWFIILLAGLAYLVSCFFMGRNGVGWYLENHTIGGIGNTNSW